MASPSNSPVRLVTPEKYKRFRGIEHLFFVFIIRYRTLWKSRRSCELKRGFMAWTLGKLFGIPVRLHFTMVLVPFLTYNWMPIRGMIDFAVWALLVILLFGSVLLHELGHALTARRYGIRTQDIVLTPIGGMARVLSMPTNPKQEIAIAVAGPLVSLSLSGISFLFLIPLSMLSSMLPVVVFAGAQLLVYINLMLGLFNLVPALPMDGGRVLRGILALKRDHLTATVMAARVGRILAGVGFVLAIVDGNFSLGLISIFVYTAAGSEVRMAQMRAYQERMQASPFGGQGGFPFPGGGDGRSWRWTWRGGYPPAGAPPVDDNAPTRRTYDPDGREWPAREIDTDRDVVVVGGKAEIIHRKDPDTKE